MDKQTVFSADLQGDLPNGLQKRLRLNVTDGASDFGDDHIGIGLLSDPVNKLLDLIGDVGNDLNR